MITTRPRTKMFGTPMNRMPLVVSIVSPSAPRHGLTSTFNIDTPEYGPGAIFGASGVSTATTSTRTSSASTSSASTSSAGIPPTAPPTVTPSQSKSHTGVIVGGVVGGIVALGVIIATLFFYLQWRRTRLLQVADVASGASQPMLSDTTVTTVTQPSPGPPIIPPAPQTLTLYVRVFMSHAAAIMCHRAPFSYYFHTHRTQMTQLRSRDTKVVHKSQTSVGVLVLN